MEDELVLASVHDLTDLTTFMARAATLGCEHVRLSAHGTALVVSVAVITRASLLDTTPTILGVRVFELATESALDRVILVRALSDRLARGELTLPLPPGIPGVSWTGVAPPAGGWRPAGIISESELARVAQEGIAEVASVSGKGALIVARVRTEVWSRLQIFASSSLLPLVAGSPRDVSSVGAPAGVALAAFGLGFLAAEAGVLESSDEVRISRAASWTRFTTTRGYVIFR